MHSAQKWKNSTIKNVCASLKVVAQLLQRLKSTFFETGFFTPRSFGASPFDFNPLRQTVWLPQNCTFSPDFRARWYTQSFRLSVCYYLDDFSYGEDDRHVDEAAAGSRQLVYKCSSNRGLSFKLSGRVVYNTLSTKPRKVIRLSAMSLFHDWAKSKIERILCWYTVASYSRMMKLVASS